MHASNYIYHHGEVELHGFLAYDDAQHKPRPAVLVAHDWTGRNEFVCQKAKILSDMGYVGFALDMYGQGRLGTTNEKKRALMAPLMGDRGLLRDRVRAAFDALSALPEVDTNRIAIIGFCLGGLCALDLARSGAVIEGAVSFHGLLSAPDGLKSNPIKAKVLALHGYDDPMVKPEQVHAFCQEMTAAQVDWQVHMYGHVQHSFTNPEAYDVDFGTIYNAVADQRSWHEMSQFLREIL